MCDRRLPPRLCCAVRCCSRLQAVLVKVYALPGWGVICIVLPCQYLFGWMIIKNK